MLRRNHRLVIFAGFALFAVVGLVGCSLFTINVNDEDSGSIQRMNVGDLLVIRLMGNASTGYEWVRVAPSSLEGSPIESIEEGEYQVLGIEPVGAPGEFVFRYRAMRPGTLRIWFEHQRPWETSEAIGSYDVTVWVR
jgi:predicted secreted protein